MYNFISTFEELNKLYEEFTPEAEKEEAVEEGCEEKLTEAVDDEVTEDEITADDEPAEESVIEEDPRQLICECDKCGALVIKNEADIVVDEESDLANVEDECQFCEEANGYKIVGIVAPYEVVAEEPLGEEPIEEGMFDGLKAKKYKKIVSDTFGMTYGEAMTLYSRACRSGIALIYEKEPTKWAEFKRKVQDALTKPNGMPIVVIGAYVEQGYANSDAAKELENASAKFLALVNGDDTHRKAAQFFVQDGNLHSRIKKALDAFGDASVEEGLLNLDMPISANVNVKADGNSVPFMNTGI